MRSIILILLFPLFCSSQNLSDSEAIYFGSTEITKVYFGSTVVWEKESLGPELYTTANALAIGANEADATTGITASNVTLTSVETPTPMDGSSMLSIVSIGSSSRANITYTLEDATTYIVSYWAYSTIADGSSNYGRSRLWEGFTVSPDVFYTTSPVFYEHELTTNSTSALFRFYCIGSAITYVDGLSIRKVL